MQWTAALHSALLQNATKSVQVQHLINYRLRPIPTVQMEAFAGMYDDMDGDVLRALSEASIVPPPRPVFVAHVNRPNNPNARMDEAKARDGVLPLPSVPLSQAELDQLELLLARKRELSAPNKGPAGGRTFKAALVKVLEGLTEKIAPAKKKVSLQPLELVLKGARKAILKGEFFEISSLNPEHLAKLKLMPLQGGIGAKKVAVNAITRTAEGYKGKVDWSALERWDLFKSGFPKWLALMLENPLSALLVADRLAWLIHEVVSVFCP